MLEYMENISQSEAENIRKTIQDLFRQTCILQTKCDPVTLIQKDNPHYQVCAKIGNLLQIICRCLTVNWFMIRRNIFSGLQEMAC